MIKAIDIENLKKILGIRICMTYPLAPLTSLRIGGDAEFWASIHNINELEQVYEIAKNEGIILRVLGGGTNLVIMDGLLKGLVVQLKGDFQKIYRSGEYIQIGGGCPLSALIKEAIRGNLVGTEGLIGIPGTIGGGIRMNAGTDIGNLGDFVEEVEIFTKEGTRQKRKPEDIRFSYRMSSIKDDEIVLGAKLRLRIAFDIAIKRELKKLLKKRMSQQPYKERTAGCVFRNPEGHSAGKLIEDAGLKNLRYGGIEVSKKHANFFINLGNGTATEFLHLMELVQNKVYKLFKVDLVPEVKIWSN